MIRTPIELGKRLGGFALLIVIAVVIITASSSFYTIDGTERAVLLNFGKPQSNPVEPGPHFKIPYQQEVVRFDIQTQKFVTTVASASKDLQDVSTEVTTNYRLDPTKIAKIYIDLGKDIQTIETKVIVPAVQETVKQVTAEYTASDLIQKRALVKSGVETGIRNRLAQYGIIVDPNGVSLTGFEYSPEFSAAIEAKVTAVQLVSIPPLIDTGTATWDMNSGSSGYTSNDPSLLGKVVQIHWETEDGARDNIIGEVSAIQDGFLYFVNPLIADFSDGPWEQLNRPNWVPVAMCEEIIPMNAMPTLNENGYIPDANGNVPAQPGFSPIGMITALLIVAGVLIYV